MVAVKAHQAQSFVATADSRYGAVLFYGGDAGLVAERSQALAQRIASRETPPGDIIRLDDTDLETDPDRLAVELRTIAMFGGRKIVRAATGRRLNTALLKPLVEEGRLEGFLIVEAGNLKPDDALRVLFEKADGAAAVACFADGERDLEALVSEVLGGSGQSISAEARELLVGRLGADRALSRGEIEKLTLYTAGRARIEADDVEAIVGDASELAIDRVTAAAAAGEAERAVAEFGRALASGEGAQAILIATQRHFHRLHRARAAVEAGRSLDDVVRQMRPPLHFKQKDAFVAQVRGWTLERLGSALTRIGAAVHASRQTGALEDLLAERLLLAIAALARDRAQSRALRG